MRRSGWTASALLHATLAALLILWHLPDREIHERLLPISLLGAEVPAPLEPAAPSPPPRGESRPTESLEHSESATGRSALGVRVLPDWVTGPPRTPAEGVAPGPPLPGPLRQARAAARNPFGPSLVPTTTDTLIWAQRRLTELATEWMEEARAAPRGQRTWEPIPVPGSIQELRGEPQIPLVPLAVAAAGLLMDLGKKAWEKLTHREGAVGEGPDLELTYEEAAAFGAMRANYGVTLFEWHARLPADDPARLGDLQRLAADLAARGMVDMQQEGNLLRYVRIVPLQDVIAYYTSFLARIPPGESTNRTLIERILVVLVREP